MVCDTPMVGVPDLLECTKDAPVHGHAIAFGNAKRGQN